MHHGKFGKCFKEKPDYQDASVLRSKAAERGPMVAAATRRRCKSL